jgi:hypothetical protein
MYKNSQITSTKYQYQMANSKFTLCLFEKWIFNIRYSGTERKIDPISICKSWNPVAI